MIKINTIKLIHGDCLDKLKQIENKSVNLVLIDPPYNISKADWDKWKTVDEYVQFMGQVFLECQRVLKDNGSFYFFHNDFEQMAELQHWINQNTRFVYKSLITIDKLDNNYIKDLYGSQEHFRNFLNLTEYVCFYTFQNENKYEQSFKKLIIRDTNNFISLRKYFEDLLIATQLKKTEIMKIVGCGADHCFRTKSSQWEMPSEKIYNELLSIVKDHAFNKKTYSDIKTLYEL